MHLAEYWGKKQKLGVDTAGLGCCVSTSDLLPCWLLLHVNKHFRANDDMCTHVAFASLDYAFEGGQR